MSSPITQLTNIIPETKLIDKSYLAENYGYSEISPEIILFPTSVEEISEALKFCFKSELGVTPVGSGTKLFVGNPTVSSKVLISLEKMNKILDHETSDMISSVQAGIKLNDFKNEITKEKQFLPIDPPFVANGATAGGVISSNISGPLSTRYGTCRELLLSVKVVRADGEIIKGGAKVVKNVAGYDIPKLFVGALGSLGILAEVSLRLFPIQEHSETLILDFTEFDQLQDCLTGIMKADIEPSCLDIYNSQVVQENSKTPYSLAIKLDNFEAAVKDQIKEIKTIVGSKPDNIQSLMEEKQEEIWKEIREFPFSRPDLLLAKFNLPISSSYKLFGELEAMSQNLNVSINSVCRPLRGGLQLTIDGSADEVVNASNLIRSQAKALGGKTMFYQLNSKLDVNVWDDFGSERILMEELKIRFDNHNILNPGKMFFN